jgi:hypothetical protein
MFQSVLVTHKEITTIQLNEIIQIKSIAWPYSYEKQLEWIHHNLKNTDIHVLLYQEEILVAYLNLIDIELKIDNILFDALGIGNVCAIEKGKGLGFELLNKTNKFIIEDHSIGLLFCKIDLVSFYTKSSWNLIEKKQLNLVFDTKNIETMIFNYNLPFKKLTFEGKAF